MWVSYICTCLYANIVKIISNYYVAPAFKAVSNETRKNPWFGYDKVSKYWRRCLIKISLYKIIKVFFLNYMQQDLFYTTNIFTFPPLLSFHFHFHFHILFSSFYTSFFLLLVFILNFYFATLHVSTKYKIIFVAVVVDEKF